MDDGRSSRMEQVIPDKGRTGQPQVGHQGEAAGDNGIPNAQEPLFTDETDTHPSFENYENDRLVLLPRDWATLYAYWDITDARKRMVERFCNRRWEQLTKVLRIYDVNSLEFSGDNANAWWDVELSERSDHGFVGGMRPDCAYCMDYGIRRPEDGAFMAILRSNSVMLPRNAEVTEPDRARIPAFGGGPGRTVNGVSGSGSTDGTLTEPAWMTRFTGYSLHAD